MNDKCLPCIKYLTQLVNHLIFADCQISYGDFEDGIEELEDAKRAIESMSECLDKYTKSNLIDRINIAIEKAKKHDLDISRSHILSAYSIVRDDVAKDVANVCKLKK